MSKSPPLATCAAVKPLPRVWGPPRHGGSFGQEASRQTQGLLYENHPFSTAPRGISESPLCLLGTRNLRPRACSHVVCMYSHLRCPWQLLPEGGTAVGTAAGTSLSGLPQGLSPSAFLPCWTATQRVTYPTEPLVPQRHACAGFTVRLLWRWQQGCPANSYLNSNRHPGQGARLTCSLAETPSFPTGPLLIQQLLSAPPPLLSNNTSCAC